MRKRRFTDRQRRKIIRETGFIYEIAARHGVSKVTIGNWRRHFLKKPTRPFRYRSDAFLWMEEHFVTLSNPPDWRKLIQQLTGEGLRNRDGSCLKIANLKLTWQRVCEARKRGVQSRPCRDGSAGSPKTTAPASVQDGAALEPKAG